jgi:cephalosporin hydroxylase
VVKITSHLKQEFGIDMKKEVNLEFQNERLNLQKIMSEDLALKKLSYSWISAIGAHKWAYNFDWLGRPAIQFPNDAWQLQELIWQTRPDLIIETGIAHGGSLIFSASMLAILDYIEAVESNGILEPLKSKRKVVGIDIDIRPHNLEAIQKHPLSHMINMIEGSSTDNEVIEEVKSISEGYNKVLVCLDSNHTYEHVLSEMQNFHKFVSVGSYLIVYDTVIEYLPENSFPDRPWGIGNNPMTAVEKFLETNSDFVVDSSIHEKLQITVAPNGFLRRVK